MCTINFSLELNTLQINGRDLTIGNICEKIVQIFEIHDSLVRHQPVFISVLDDTLVRHPPGKVSVRIRIVINFSQLLLKLLINHWVDFSLRDPHQSLLLG